MALLQSSGLLLFMVSLDLCHSHINIKRLAGISKVIKSHITEGPLGGLLVFLQLCGTQHLYFLNLAELSESESPLLIRIPFLVTSSFHLVSI